MPCTLVLLFGVLHFTPTSLSIVLTGYLLGHNLSFDFRFALSYRLSLSQFVSCRPKDEGVDEKIEELIADAATRTEPMELVPQSFLPAVPRVSVQSREEKVLTTEWDHGSRGAYSYFAC